MSDLISRKDAIDEVKRLHSVAWENWKETRISANTMIDALKDLPSAEPTIIRCRDCKHHDGIRCFRWNSTIITGFDDFCSNAEKRGEEE